MSDLTRLITYSGDGIIHLALANKREIYYLGHRCSAKIFTFMHLGWWSSVGLGTRKTCSTTKKGNDNIFVAKIPPPPHTHTHTSHRLHLC